MSARDLTVLTPAASSAANLSSAIAFTARDRCASVAHTFTWRAVTPAVRNNWLGYVRFNERCRFFFRSTTDLTNLLRLLQSQGLLGTVLGYQWSLNQDWVTTDTNTCRLTEAFICCLFNCFVSKSTWTRYDTYFTFLVDVTRHDAPILHSSGVIRPGQLGPIMRTPVSSSFTLTSIMSVVGIPSVIVTISSILHQSLLGLRLYRKVVRR